MFDFAWTEIALIGIVALIAIGPKDMPVAIKAVAEMIKKARKMAGEFQTHVDEMVREANLDEVRSQITQIRNLDIKGTIERAVDNDGSLRRTFREDPLKDAFKPNAPAPAVTADAATAESVLADAQATPGVAAPDPFGGAAAGPPTSIVAAELAAAASPQPHKLPEAPEGVRTMERPSFIDAASGEVPEPAPAPPFIPPAIAAPPVPPAFIPPGAARVPPSGGFRPRAG
jgi:sec-independent protein translocase protein TatB